MSLDALNDIKAFESLKKKDRTALEAEVKEALGPDWKLDEEQELEAAVWLFHNPTRLPFVLVPGGTFEMGLTNSDLAALKKVTKWSDTKIKKWSPRLRHLTPAHQVKVAPFITMQATLTHEEVERLSKNKWSGVYCYKLAREDSRSLAVDLGFRLPSDAEHEWLARDGRQLAFTLDVGPQMKATSGDTELLDSRFDVTDMFLKQWMADDHHPSYEGAPSNSQAWVGAGEKGTSRGGTDPEAVEDDDELPALLACYRPEEPTSKAATRLTVSFASFEGRER